jgi:hypothetical protein
MPEPITLYAPNGQPFAPASAFSANEIRVLNDIISRVGMANRQLSAFNGLRNYELTFGYHPQLNFEDYWSWYKRGGIAKRIIDLPCDATWRHDPEILDDESSETENQFEATWKSLNKRLGLTAKLHRADILQSIGRYSVMLLGVNDGKQLDQPLESTFTSPDDLLYVQVLSEKHAEIAAFVNDPADARYGLPERYQVTLGSSEVKTAQVTTKTIPVHHSRILHFAEGCLEDDVLGTSRLEAVFNLLMDLLKVSGGGAETYWLNAANKYSIENQEGFSFDPTDMETMKTKVTDLIHNLSSVVALNGARAVRMGVQVADPTGQYQVVMQQLAGTTNIPQRLLTGTESGELASTQDRKNWNETIMSRHHNHAGPVMVRPTINRLIDLGIMPAPSKDEYIVKWKNLLELSDAEKAQLALTRAQAASAYVGVGGDVERVYAPLEFRESMGLMAKMSAEAKRSIAEMGQDEEPDDENDPQVQEQFAKAKLRRVV